MSFTLVSEAAVTVEGSGTTLQTNGDITGVQAGDLIVASCNWDGATTTCTVSDGTSTFTAPAGNQVGGAGGTTITQCFRYLLSSVATGTVTYTMTLAQARSFRRIMVRVFRPTATPEYVGLAQAGGSSNSPNSGNLAVTGTDILAVGAGCYFDTQFSTTRTINGESVTGNLIAGVDSGAANGYAEQAYLLKNAGFTGAFAASLAGSDGWAAHLAAFRIAPDEPVDAEAAIAVPSAQLSATVQIGRSVSAALTLPAALLSAASSVSRSASGALDVPAVELEAAAGIVTLCEGALGIPAAQIASTASIERSASAALTVPSTTLDATSSAGRTASAAIVVTVPAVAATATTLRTVSAAIETPAAELSATAARTVAAAADIQTPAVGLQASASIVRLASGDLAIAVPVVDATAAGEELTVSASLAIPAVEVEASALISRTAQGTLTVPAVELSSDVEREVTAEGLLILTAPSVEAQAAIERLVQADIELPEAIVAAQAFSGAIQSVIGLRASVRKLGTLSATVTPIGKKATLQ